MRQRPGSIHALRRDGSVQALADRAADPALRHRPRRHSGLTAEQESILDLQRLAGNNAVAQALAEGRASGRVVSVDAIEIAREGMPPKTGIQQIREHTKNKMSLALTQRGLENSPPLMRPEASEKTKDGYTARSRKIGSIPEPIIHEWWPKEGLHILADGTYREVSHDWEKKLEEGEDEHRDDAQLAWKLTWKKVQDTINSFAEKPGPAEPTPEAAQKALWKRYVAALPKDLQPAGDAPSDARQLEILSIKPGTFMAWMWELTVARDQRSNHETIPGPATGTVPAPKDANVTGIAPHPEFKIKGPTSEALIEDIRKKYTPGKIIQGSKLKDGDSTGDVSK